jgi:hypothetical protein
MDTVISFTIENDLELLAFLDLEPFILQNGVKGEFYGDMCRAIQSDYSNNSYVTVALNYWTNGIGMNWSTSTFGFIGIEIKELHIINDKEKIIKELQKAFFEKIVTEIKNEIGIK